MDSKDPPSLKDFFPWFLGPPPGGKVTGSQVAGVCVVPGAEWWHIAQDTLAKNFMAIFNANITASITLLEEYNRQRTEPWDAFTNPWGEIIKANHQAWERDYRESGRSPGGELYQRLKFLFSGSGAAPAEIKAIINQSLRGPQAVRLAKALGDVIPGAGQLYDEKYNGKFLHEPGAGKIEAYDVDALVQQFVNNQPGAKFPHVVLTSSHAQGETLEDVTSITHGIESLIHHSQGEMQPISAMKTPPEGLKKPLILYACDTHKNPFLNSAELMQRLDVLASTGGKVSFEHASPGARRIARLMLKCMVETPDAIPIDDPRPLSEILTAPVKLRPSAERIAQHFHLIGYSKGGNTVSDAMRYLIEEMTAKDQQNNPLIMFAPAQEEGNTLPPQARIHNLVRNIACASFAAIEVPMAQYYKEHGVRRFAVNNEYDQVANHKPYKATRGDRRDEIKGSPDKLGHDPAAALGTRDKRGYFLDDPFVARRLKEWFAPMFGKAAISSISFEDPRMQQDGRSILIGTAPGTPDELLMQYKDTITMAMRDAGLAGSKINTISNQNGRAFILTFPQNIENKDDIRKLKAGFEALRKDDVKGLVIAEEILDTTIKNRLEALEKGRGKTR
jgi:hypothetical protein